MKTIHWLALASAIVAVVLLFAGLPKMAGLLVGVVTVAELVGAIATGKQSNEGPS